MRCTDLLAWLLPGGMLKLILKIKFSFINLIAIFFLCFQIINIQDIIKANSLEEMKDVYPLET